MKKILVVEDDKGFRQMLVDYLESLGFTSANGYKIVEADDEEPAVKLATQDPSDLILMDGNLRTGNGASAVKKMRQLGVSAIIIMVSGDSKECQKGLAAGANEVLNKQYIAENLKPLLQRLGINP